MPTTATVDVSFHCMFVRNQFEVQILFVMDCRKENTTLLLYKTIVEISLEYLNYTFKVNSVDSLAGIVNVLESYVNVIVYWVRVFRFFYVQLLKCVAQCTSVYTSGINRKYYYDKGKEKVQNKVLERIQI